MTAEASGSSPSPSRGTRNVLGASRHTRASPAEGPADGSESELAHPLQGQHDIGDLMFRVVTERVERLVNSFCRDRRLPEKGPETGGGRNPKLAIAGRGEHDAIRTARSSNPDAADSVSHRTSPPGILLREPVAAGQREFRVRRARAACTTHPTIRPTNTRTAPSRTSASRSVQSPAIIGTLGSDARCGAPDPHYRHAMPVLWPIESCRRDRSSGVGCAKIAHMKRTVAASNSVNVSTALTIADLLRWRRTRSNVPGARAWTVPPAVAVVAHRQAPRRATPRQPAPSASRTTTSRPWRRQRDSRPRPRAAGSPGGPGARCP